MEDAEVLKHYDVLGLEEGCSEVELEAAYQERAQAWNPDKFAGNEALRRKAQEKLRHIDAAYEFLRGRRFRAEMSDAPEAITASPAPQPIQDDASVPDGKRAVRWVIAAVFVLLFLGAVLLLFLETSW